MNLEQKIEIFTMRLAQDPYSRVFAPLADLLRQAGRLDDALELLDDGLIRHPDYLSALVIKGRALLDSGHVDQARQVLAGVLDRDPENFVVLRLMTEDARSRQAWEESIPLLEKLVVLDPDDDRWPGALAEARKFAQRDHSAGPVDSSFATMTLVDIYLAQGYRAKALAALSRMADREPERTDILQRIAEIRAEGPAVPADLEGGAQSPRTPGETLAGLGDQRTSRRTSEKKKFEEWIGRLRDDGGPSS
ncbi:MAG: tetratricopeptide repeat protein [Candidatus Krumholzibacteria bacterium]|nr:tetratricopeptide repeat protein [Candidatus Krumholzibacteria bacterium]